MNSILPAQSDSGFQGLTIQKISEENIAAALAVGFSCFPETREQIHLEATYRSFVRQEEKLFSRAHQQLVHLLTYFLYSCEGAVSGVGGLYRCESEEHRVWLGWFGVHPNCRHRGVGTRILTSCEHYAALQGMPQLALYTGSGNTGAAAFYRSRGFLKSEERVPGFPHCFVFNKVLAATANRFEA